MLTKEGAAKACYAYVTRSILSKPCYRIIDMTQSSVHTGIPGCYLELNKYAWNMHGIWMEYVWNMHNMHYYAWTIQGICLEYARICLAYARNVLGICMVYV